MVLKGINDGNNHQGSLSKTNPMIIGGNELNLSHRKTIGLFTYKLRVSSWHGSNKSPFISSQSLGFTLILLRKEEVDCIGLNCFNLMCNISYCYWLFCYISPLPRHAPAT